MNRFGVMLYLTCLGLLLFIGCDKMLWPRLGHNNFITSFFHTLHNKTCSILYSPTQIIIHHTELYQHYSMLTHTYTSTYCILFIICWENVFHGLLHNRKRFLENYCTWILGKLVKAGNHESFFGNEGKDLTQQKFFTVNNR